MHDDDALSPQAGRYGEHVRGGGVSFRCAACGEMAAVVRLVRAGTTVNMGPPLGEEAYDRDGVIVDFWLGSTCWRVDPAMWARLEQVLAGGQPDPAGLHQIDWELAAYWCRDCRRCYCRDDWQKTAVWDGPFYDYTDGVCPAGHHHMIDD